MKRRSIMPRRVVRLVAMLSLGALLVSACGGEEAGTQASPSSGGETAAEGPPQDVVWLSASGNTPNLALFSSYIAAENFDTENGIEATVEQSPSAQAVAALVSGSKDFSMTAFGGTATAIAQGHDLVIVGAYTLRVPAVIVAKKEIKELSDLEGKNVVAAALGNTSHTAVLAYAEATGDADGSKFNFVASGNTANSIQYMRAGTGDAAWIQVDSAAQLIEQNPDLHILVSEDEMQEAVGTIGGVLVVTRDYAEQNGDTITKVMQSLIQANRALYEDEDYFVDKAMEAFPAGTYSEELLRELYPTLQDTMAVNGGMDEELIEKSYDAWAEYFDPESAKSASFKKGKDIVDPSFVKAALENLDGPVDHPIDSADLATSSN
jgi:ABC-type nitrate/sulfonate/bicarbonate transport system substrate-binding protein